MSKSDLCILIDADVVSHFISAGEMLALPEIYSYPIYILDKVYVELEKFPGRRKEVENLLLFGRIKELPFPESNHEIRKEYASLKKTFRGDGESASLAVARYTGNIIASSNLKDIYTYCTEHRITYLTTMHFLCEALRTGFFDIARCNLFIQKVLSADSKLPVKKMEDYRCQ